MKVTVLIATIAILNAPASLAQETRPRRELLVNGFRSPSIGLEYREGAYSFHSGYYTTILSRRDSQQNRSTAFLKTGVNYYFSGNAAREWFVSASHVRGLTEGWKREGAFLELGQRWQLTKQVEFRLGAGVLLVSGKPARLNPTPGVSLRFPLR